MIKSYRELLVLSYFKEFSLNYSIEDLKNRIGLSYMETIELLHILIEQKLLRLNNYSIGLTLKGRTTLGKTSMDNFKFISYNELPKEERIDYLYHSKTLTVSKWIKK